MSRPLVSICLSTYQRAHLLARSLECYERSEGIDVKSDLELVVIDDHSTDDTAYDVRGWSRRTGIRAVVLTPHPKTTGWRDCGAVLNYGIRASSGKHVILTHPEVMPGRRSVAACVDKLGAFDSNARNYYEKAEWGYVLDPERKPDSGRLTKPVSMIDGVVVTPPPLGLYACCKVYYLSPQDQTRIDTVDWKGKGAIAVRDIEGFYEDDTNGHPDYSHRATDIVAKPGSRMPVWESFVFSGHSRETWKRLGGFLESVEWGSCDVAWSHRRRTLGIPNHTCPDDDTIVVHQNHNLPGDVPTDRDMDKWVKELSTFPLNDPMKMCYPYVDNL